VGQHPGHEQAARALGLKLAARGWTLVYGGGNVGLMGAMAREMLAAGGEIVGVIPQALLDIEVGMRDATELIVTETLRERKGIMDERSDAFVALPGGFGTFEELIEVLTLRQLRYHAKPIIIANLHGYYDPLLSLFAHGMDEGYIPQRHGEMYEVVTSVDEIFSVLDQAFAQAASVDNGERIEGSAAPRNGRASS
jgi:hypothetical protein